MGHGPHSFTLVVICVVMLLFVLFYVLFVCKYVLPPGDNPIAVNKIYHIKPYGRKPGMLRSLVCVPMTHLTMVSVLQLVRPFEFSVIRGPHVLFDAL